MATAQLTRDVITLKGSAAIASEFLCYSGTRSNGFTISSSCFNRNFPWISYIALFQSFRCLFSTGVPCMPLVCVRCLRANAWYSVWNLVDQFPPKLYDTSLLWRNWLICNRMILTFVSQGIWWMVQWTAFCSSEAFTRQTSLHEWRSMEWLFSCVSRKKWKGSLTLLLRRFRPGCRLEPSRG